MTEPTTPLPEDRRPHLRPEDPDLLRGIGRYVPDLGHGDLVADFVRSPHAHAAIVGVDAGAATRAPGVVGVWSAGDLGLARLPTHPMLPRLYDRPVLAAERVRYVGEPVAVVVASSAAAAVDAVDLVDVDYRLLEPVVDPRRSLDPDAPLLHPEAGTNLAFDLTVGNSDAPLDGADVVVEVAMVNQRVAACPMETEGARAVPDRATDGVTVWASTQRVHHVRDQLAAVLGLDPSAVRVVTPRVGGGFGSKFEMAPEVGVVAALALRLDAPVSWVPTRRESMQNLPGGRGQHQVGRLGLRRDGTFVGLDVDVLADAGAHPIVGALIPNATLRMASGPYRIPALRGRGRSAVTTTTPVGAFRGAGRPEACALIERLVERAADRLDVDPNALRRRNLLTADEFPATTASGLVYDSGEPRRYLDEACRRIDHDGVRREQRRRRAVGHHRAIGIATCPWMDITPMTRPGEYGRVRIAPDAEHPDGVVVEVAVGTCDHGQGHEGTWGLLAARVLGVPDGSVRLLPSDTAIVPYGDGTGSARSLQLAGGAVDAASREVLARARTIVASMLEAAEDDIVVSPDGGLAVAGSPGAQVSWRAVLDAADGPEVLDVALDYVQDGPTFPGGVHAAVVEVDQETGEAEVTAFVAVDDCGHVVNPTVVAGQQHGGIAQGIAQALYESVAHDPDGNPLTSTFADYLVPSAADLPSIDASTIAVPTGTPVSSLGSKGIGQAGAIGSTAAVQNAVIDAVSHLGVTHIDLPLSPERVYTAIARAAVTTATAAASASRPYHPERPVVVGEEQR